MKSIRMKIVACMLIAILTSLVIVGGISAWLNYTSTIDTLGQTMTEMADTAAERIEEELNAYKNIAYVTGLYNVLVRRILHAQILNFQQLLFHIPAPFRFYLLKAFISVIVFISVIIYIPDMI